MTGGADRDRAAAFFDAVIDKIEAHPSYSANVAQAVSKGERLVLNYHTHGPNQPYCVSVCTLGVALDFLGESAPLHELAHIRGVGQRREDAALLLEAFAERLQSRFGLVEEPLGYLEGAPLEGGDDA